MELANILSNWSEIPLKINDTKACEISLLAGYALIKLKEEEL